MERKRSPARALFLSSLPCSLTCCHNLHGHRVAQLQEIRVISLQLQLLTQCQGRILEKRTCQLPHSDLFIAIPSKSCIPPQPLARPRCRLCIVYY